MSYPNNDACLSALIWGHPLRRNECWRIQSYSEKQSFSKPSVTKDNTTTMRWLHRLLIFSITVSRKFWHIEAPVPSWDWLVSVNSSTSALTATTTTSTHTPFSQNISFTMVCCCCLVWFFYVTGPIPTINPEDYVFLKAVLYTGCLLRDPFLTHSQPALTEPFWLPSSLLFLPYSS